MAYYKNKTNLSNHCKTIRWIIFRKLCDDKNSKEQIGNRNRCNLIDVVDV